MNQISEWEKLRDNYKIRNIMPSIADLERIFDIGDRLQEKADKYDAVEFLVIEINGKPDDIVHLHSLLDQKQRLDAIKTKMFDVCHDFDSDYDNCEECNGDPGHENCLTRKVLDIILGVKKVSELGDEE